jgi:hypothetical protein
VLLQEGIHLHACVETEKPAKLSGCERMGSVCFQCQTLERCSRQVFHLDSSPCPMSSGSSNVIRIPVYLEPIMSARSPPGHKAESWNRVGLVYRRAKQRTTQRCMLI